MILIDPGTTSLSIDVYVGNDSGLPVEGLVAATFPPVWISRGSGNDEQLVLSDLANLTAAWASGGVKERGGGQYRLDLPNSVGATPAIVTIRAEAANKRLVVDKLQVRTMGTGTGTGDWPVNHNSGGVDRLRVVVTGTSTGIDGADISAYVKSLYQAGGASPNCQTRSKADGRWNSPLMLDAGDWAIVIKPPGYTTKIYTVVVAANGATTVTDGLV